MNLLKIFSISFLILCSIILTKPLHAETTKEGESTPQLVVVADVNIYDAKITSQEGGQINISFELANGEGVQAGVRYGVSLLKDTTDGQFLVDEFIYPETLSLSANSSLMRNISYIAPAGLSGEYSLLIEVKNESGFPLGFAMIGEVKLAATEKMVQILPESCYLNVVGEKDNPKYDLTQGVDIEKTENLKLTCSAINSSPEVISITPSYETHLRSIYGLVVQTEGGDLAPISFQPGEKKNISLTLPKALKSQSYETKISLKSGNLSSNYIKVNYVLRGVSATIDNFSLDKDKYLKDDVAKLSFIWSPSADTFSGGRYDPSTPGVLTLEAIMTNDKNKECITKIIRPMADVLNGGMINLSVPVTANCENPQASVLLKDASGNILDQKFLKFESKKIDDSLTDKASGSTKTIMIAFGILIVVGIALYFISLKKKENETFNQ